MPRVQYLGDNIRQIITYLDESSQPKEIKSVFLLEPSYMFLSAQTRTRQKRAIPCGVGSIRSLTHSPTPPLKDQMVGTIVTGCNQALVSSMGSDEEYLLRWSQVGLLQIILALTHTKALQVH